MAVYKDMMTEEDIHKFVVWGRNVCCFRNSNEIGIVQIAQNYKIIQPDEESKIYRSVNTLFCSRGFIFIICYSYYFIPLCVIL